MVWLGIAAAGSAANLICRAVALSLWSVRGDMGRARAERGISGCLMALTVKFPRGIQKWG